MGHGKVLKDLVQLVLDIIPDNLLVCFTIDNDLQVIVISIFIGIVLLSFGEKVSKINQAIANLSEIFNKTMAIVCKILPLIVYLGILRMLLSDMSDIIVCGTILGHFLPADNGFLIQLESLITAKELNLLDETILEKTETAE